MPVSLHLLQVFRLATGYGEFTLSKLTISPCAVCGRRLQIKVSLLGSSVCCPHCQAVFSASSELGERTLSEGKNQQDGSISNDSSELMARVEDVLERSKSSDDCHGVST